MRTSYLLVTFVLMQAIFVSAFAQETSTNKDAEEVVNIKELVDKQIQEIKEQEAKNQLKPSDKYDNEAAIIPVKDSETEIISGLTVSKDLLEKFFLFIEASLLVVIGFFFRKKLLKTRKDKRSKLKENIKKLREEKLGGMFDNSLVNVRKQLILQPIKIDGRTITSHAKKLSISKGEVYLAAKINMMMNNPR